jgi:hypothetical protein
MLRLYKLNIIKYKKQEISLHNCDFGALYEVKNNDLYEGSVT